VSLFKAKMKKKRHCQETRCFFCFCFFKKETLGVSLGMLQLTCDGTSKITTHTHIHTHTHTNTHTYTHKHTHTHIHTHTYTHIGAKR
jgi:hypothetical protein